MASRRADAPGSTGDHETPRTREGGKVVGGWARCVWSPAARPRGHRTFFERYAIVGGAGRDTPRLGRCPDDRGRPHAGGPARVDIHEEGRGFEQYGVEEGAKSGFERVDALLQRLPLDA